MDAEMPTLEKCHANCHANLTTQTPSLCNYWYCLHKDISFGGGTSRKYHLQITFSPFSLGFADHLLNFRLCSTSH